MTNGATIITKNTENIHLKDSKISRIIPASMEFPIRSKERSIAVDKSSLNYPLSLETIKSSSNGRKKSMDNTELFK